MCGGPCTSLPCDRWRPPNLSGFRSLKIRRLRQHLWNLMKPFPQKAKGFRQLLFVIVFQKFNDKWRHHKGKHDMHPMGWLGACVLRQLVKNSGRFREQLFKIGVQVVISHFTFLPKLAADRQLTLHWENNRHRPTAWIPPHCYRVRMARRGKSALSTMPLKRDTHTFLG